AVKDRRLRRGGGRRRGRGAAAAARADHDRDPRHRRRRNRDRDVPADLRLDQQADVMLDRNLRRTVAWMIAVRAIMGTLLLGSATFAQITAPGSFPVNPFFFLIGLTYALTIGYGITLRFVDRPRWLVDLQLARGAPIV